MISFRDYCRFEGKVFDERALYNKEDPNWIAFQKYQGWLRAKARNGGKDFVPRDRKPRFKITTTEDKTMTIFIVDIEAVDTRYTKQWKEYLPKQLQRATNEDVVVISGGETPQATTPGAFLNFGGTNVYKSKQLETIGEMFCKGQVADGDYFLYTDAWNPTVIQLKYMAELTRC